MDDKPKKVRDGMRRIKELNAGEKALIDRIADDVAALFPDPDSEALRKALNLSDGTDGKKGSTIQPAGS